MAKVQFEKAIALLLEDCDPYEIRIGRHTFNQNRVIVLFDFIDIGSQRELPAHGVYQAHFHNSKVRFVKEAQYRVDKPEYGFLK